MVDARISPDLAIDLARRVGLIEDARDEANGDLKQAWADAREQFKVAGLSGAEIASEVAQLKGAIAETRLDDKAKQKRWTKAEGVDGYLEIITSPRARARARVDRTNTARETLASTTTADPAGEADDASSADTLQEGSEPIEAHNLDRAGSTPAPATTSTEQPTRPLVDEAGQHDGGIDRGSVDTEPEGASIGAKPSMASEPAGEATSDASPVAPFRMKQGGFNDGLYRVDWLRRHGKCLNEDSCVVAPGKLCKGCSLAMHVKAGGQEIPHQGQVA